MMNLDFLLRRTLCKANTEQRTKLRINDIELGKVLRAVSFDLICIKDDLKLLTKQAYDPFDMYQKYKVL